MKWILIAIATLMPVNQAAASTAMVCLFKPLTMRFNLLVKNGHDMIQWEGGAFQAVVVEFEKPYMTVKHYASSATFKAVIDINNMRGYGGIKTYAGDASEGDIICALD